MMKIDYDKGKYSVLTDDLLGLPKLVSDETITVQVLEYEDGSRGYFVRADGIPSARLNELLQDLHLKRNHKNTGLS